MKIPKRAIFGVIAVLIICMLCGAKKTSARTCIKAGCNKKSATGSSYCYIHKPSSITMKSNNTKKKNNINKKNPGTYKSSQKITTKKTDYIDMPDCDDYGSWGEFMDDWDGNMPDGSDASDYWDNW